MKSSFCSLLLILSILLVLGSSSLFIPCTYASNGSYCSSGCCTNHSSTNRPCLSSSSFCNQTTSNNSTYSSSTSVGDIGTGLIIGVSVGSSLCFILTVVGIVCFIRYYRASRQQDDQIIERQLNENVNNGSGTQTIQTTVIPQYPPQYGYQYNVNTGNGMGMQQPYLPFGQNVPIPQ